MNLLCRKLASRRGETLSEALAAILVVSLSSAAFAALVTTASRLNVSAMESDAKLYEDIAAVEQQMGGASEREGTVKVKLGDTEVSFGAAFYTTGGLAAYEKRGSGT